MAKRPVKKSAKKKAAPADRKMDTIPSASIVREENECSHKGCKSGTVYMKRNRKTGEMEHWCAKHFQTDVVEPNKKAYLDAQPEREPFVEHHKRHPRKKVVKKGGALKPAVDAATAKKKVRVKK